MDDLQSIIQIFVSTLTFFVGQQNGAQKEKLNQKIILDKIQNLNEKIQSMQLEIYDIKNEIREINPTLLIVKNEMEHCKEDIKTIKE